MVVIGIPGSSHSAVGGTTAPFDQQAVIHFLNQVIDWYQNESADRTTPAGPLEVAFMNQNQPAAAQILHLSFDFARAAVELLPTEVNPIPSGSSYEALKRFASVLEASSSVTRSQMRSVQDKLATAPQRQRPALESQLAKLASQSAMTQARLDTLHGILGFAADNSDPSGLTSHIEALEHSFPTSASGNPSQSGIAVSSPDRISESRGIWALTQDTMRLSAKLRSIGGKIRQTDELISDVKQFQVPLRNQLAQLSQNADNIANRSNSQDSAIAVEQKADLDALTDQFKRVAAAAVPLSKQAIVLDIYRANLANWYDGTKREYAASLKSLLFRVVALVVLIAAVFGVFGIWRKAILRYIPDYRRRYQFLLLRRIVLWMVIAVVITLGLVSQFGSLMTFAGLMTAGVAVALQNVILAIVGYFMLIGKFGVGVGDRVQVSDMTGQVVDVGLIRLHVMELTGLGLDAQPTGRIVAFSNSIVFQTTAGLFKQIPGANFVWRQISFTLMSENHYQEIENRLQLALDSVFEEFKADFEQLGRRMERNLSSVAVAPLRPWLRFKLTPAGLDVVLRFPVEMNKAEEIEDRITRELLREIDTEPKLKVVAADVPGILTRTNAAASNAV